MSATRLAPSPKKTLTIERVFTTEGVHPYDQIEWEKRDAIIPGEKGPVFEQRGVEVPKSWSMTATNVVASKYFRGKLTSTNREFSVKQMIDRVAKQISAWGIVGGYFDEPNARVFEEELTHILVNQMGAFNSPVWFNIGVPNAVPQASACFILSVEDNMPSILDWFKNEGMIFKGGSGAGVNLSNLRSSKEQLSGGGWASGPVSFMRAADSVAGSVKSGGTTRRAAKMVVLNVGHPDVREFIWCKAKEEKKAWALGEQGYDMGLNGDAWQSIQFQNANNSVRVNDAFMRAVVSNADWGLRAITDDVTVETVKAKDLLREIAQATWECGDPGMQYDDACNSWHTRADTNPNTASNPCSEFISVDNSACNLASINLLKFVDENFDLDVERFKAACRTFILAQEILVGDEKYGSAYPTPEITRTARANRELGLGYMNLGALLMARGLPYDSDEGRAYSAAVTAIMTGEAYAESANIARVVGPYTDYEANRGSHLRVMRRHRDAVEKLEENFIPESLITAARDCWTRALDEGLQNGYRNAQATLLAPTGTISFLVDADTTGVEPDIALVKYKKLVGGGLLKLVNQTVAPALARLGYDDLQRKDILAHIEATGTIEGAPHLRTKDLPIFDCAFKPEQGVRFIAWPGHVKMMASVQPFLSGAVSKTCNAPESASVEEIEEIYLEAWRRGLKAIAIYRDGSKKVQPLSTGSSGNANAKAAIKAVNSRRKLPDTRQSVTHKFSIGGHEGYITVGLFDDGTPGELFVRMAKEGSTLGGMADAWAQSVSFSLQYGVPLSDLVSKFMYQSFEPAGWTGNPEIGFAKSIVDYVIRWVGGRFLSLEDRSMLGMVREANPSEEQLSILTPTPVAHTPSNAPEVRATSVGPRMNSTPDAPPCQVCGWLMIKNASCFKCENCGATSGCS